MLRPDVFQHPCVPVRNLPYKDTESHTVVPDSGGVLSTWQIVWTDRICGVHSTSHEFIAYVDGIGEVAVDPHCLMPLNLFHNKEASDARL